MFQNAFVCYLFQDCGKRHFWEVTYEITSPGYPDNYEDNVRCFYYIHNPFNHLMTITFQTFDIEYIDDCEFDYLMVGIGRIAILSCYFNAYVKTGSPFATLLSVFHQILTDVKILSLEHSVVNVQ